jgi:FkbM family methyltransferase
VSGAADYSKGFLDRVILTMSINLIWRILAPRSYWNMRLAQIKSQLQEPELALLPALADQLRPAVDAGADGRTFIAHLLGRATDVLAFEPRPRQAGDLQEMVKALELPVRVEQVALSNESGTATLRMLVNDLGRSTIDVGNTLDDPDGSPRVEQTVPMKRLDDYSLDRLGFLKIDVEGHELAVLAGAEQTIERTGCNVLVETEDRHHAGAPAAVFEWLRVRGYLGYYLMGERIWPVHTFDRVIHQNESNIGGWRSGWARKGTYVNNFMFIPADRAAAFLDSCAALGAHKAT